MGRVSYVTLHKTLERLPGVKTCPIMETCYVGGGEGGERSEKLVTLEVAGPEIPSIIILSVRRARRPPWKAASLEGERACVYAWM